MHLYKIYFSEKNVGLPFAKEKFLCYNRKVFRDRSPFAGQALGSTSLFPGGFAMIARLLTLLTTPVLRLLPAAEIPWGVLIAELVIAAILLLCTFLFRRRFLKIICICGTEICLFLACKLAFGSDSVVTEIMRWFTAIVACIVTVSIVNRINWSTVRGKSGK